MMKRHVFAVTSLPDAEAVVQTARRHGVEDNAISLEASSAVEIADISDEFKNVSMDFVPAAWHGALGGAAAGFVLGLVAMSFASFGMTFTGALVLLVVGALVGMFASALVGSAIPDSVRRTFQREIAAGKILVVIDAEPEAFEKFEADIAKAGGTRLSFDAISALN